MKERGKKEGRIEGQMDRSTEGRKEGWQTGRQANRQKDTFFTHLKTWVEKGTARVKYLALGCIPFTLRPVQPPK